MKKNLFIKLILLINLFIFLFFLIIFGSLWFTDKNFTYIYIVFSWVVIITAITIGFFSFWLMLGVIVNIYFGKTLPLFKSFWKINISLLLPLVVAIGKLFGISRGSILQAFIMINNKIVEQEKRIFNPDEILLLLPRCLHNSKCDKRITFDLNRCERCGKCPIGGLLDRSEKYGIYMAIATGGTMARRIVVQRRPKLILACACELDLTTGIQDTYPLFVYGILNSRPQGPCINTQISLNHVEQTIRNFLSPNYLDRVQNNQGK